MLLEAHTDHDSPQVGANASVALLSVGAACVIFIAQPIFDIFGVRTIILGGWTYVLYTGSLLNYNHTHNGAFVITSGALLGLGAAFLWITQGAIMLSYPLPHQKGRSRSQTFLSELGLMKLRHRSFLGHLQPRRRDRVIHLLGNQVRLSLSFGIPLTRSQLPSNQGWDCLGFDLHSLHGDHGRGMGALLLPPARSHRETFGWYSSGATTLRSPRHQSLVAKVHARRCARGPTHCATER